MFQYKLWSGFSGQNEEFGVVSIISAITTENSEFSPYKFKAEGYLEA